MQRILITVRSQTLADALTLALSDRFAVHSCTTGAELCRTIRQQRPDALVIDLRLPEENVFSLLAQCPHKPSVILAVTDFVSDAVESWAADAGICALVRMPCSARYVAEILNQLIKVPSPEG